MSKALTNNDSSYIRLALQDRIVSLLKKPNLTEAKKYYQVYLKVGGYDSWFSQKELVELGKEVPE